MAAVFAKLRNVLRGPLIMPGDPAYEPARRIWNGRIDRHPLAIARCSDIADVITCVRFCREYDLPLAVKGSGHAVAGTALCDGGLVVDLAGLKGIRVSPGDSGVLAEPGVTWGHMDHATQRFGLAVPGGTDSEVGISGLSLGGGNGWLMGAFGATCDSILSVDIVTADGELVTASAAENDDLFWAVRGGVGRFNARALHGGMLCGAGRRR